MRARAHTQEAIISQCREKHAGNYTIFWVPTRTRARALTWACTAACKSAADGGAPAWHTHASTALEATAAPQRHQILGRKLKEKRRIFQQYTIFAVEYYRGLTGNCYEKSFKTKCFRVARFF